MEDARIRSEALEWVIRLGDPRFTEFEALTAWLAASPEHARVFNALQLAEEDLVAGLREPEAEAGGPVAVAPVDAAQGQARPGAAFAVNDNPARTTMRWAMPALAAAAAVCAVGAWTVLRGEHGAGNAWQDLRTAAGARRDVRLADGTRILLDGDTRLRVAVGGRTAQIDTGEALFDVRHDSGRPFRVQAGDVTVTDVGTRFTVEREGARIAVEVAEGAVELAGRGTARISLGAGDGAVLEDGRWRRHAVTGESVGDWSTGRLVFEDASFAQVLARVRRSTGLRLAMADDARARRFTGTVRIDGPPGAIRGRLEALLGIALRVEDPQRR